MHMFGDLVLIYYPTLLKHSKLGAPDECSVTSVVWAVLRAPESRAVVKTPTIANQLTNHICKRF